MARGKSGDGAASHLPPLVDPRLIKALDHVLRQHILLAAVQSEVSPCELSEALGEGLSQVSYHVKVLRDDCDGMIEPTRTEPRRGAMEHYYRATEKTLLPAKAWRRVKKGLRAVVGAGQASDLFNDLAEALKAGQAARSAGPHQPHPARPRRRGQRNVKAIAERATKEVEDEQQAPFQSAWRRLTATAARLAGYTFALLAFEAAWEPADPGRREQAGQAQRGAEGGGGGGGGGGGSGPLPGLRFSAGRRCPAPGGERETPPKYDVATVEAVFLEVAAELHPQHLTATDLSLRIVGHPDDGREVETAAEAIRNLREFGLFRLRDDEIVEPTPAALRAHALLA